jgi:hypothetical protein
VIVFQADDKSGFQQHDAAETFQRDGYLNYPWPLLFEYTACRHPGFFASVKTARLEIFSVQDTFHCPAPALILLLKTKVRSANEKWKTKRNMHKQVRAET